MKPLRVGIIGTGLAAQRLHLPALLKLKDLFTLAACASRSEASALAFALKAGIPVVEADAEALLQRKDVDVVLLSLPIELNAHWALKALNCGKAVMSEKPLAATRSEGEALCQAAQRAGAPLLLVAENCLFWPHMAQAVSLVKTGALGSVRLAVLHQAMDAREGAWLTPWRAVPRFAGGLVLDCGVHWAALLNAMFGEAVEVLARPAACDPALPPIDTGAALICYRGGTRVLWATTYSAAPAAEALLTVHGSEGSVAIFMDRTDWRNAAGDLQVLTSAMDSYEAEWRHLHEALRGRIPLAYSAVQALRDLDLTLKVCGQ